MGEGQGPGGARITLIGEVSVAAGDGRPVRITGVQPAAGLALLVLERHRSVHQHELAEVLWGGERGPHWRAAVRGVVAKVRSALMQVGLPPEVITTDQGVLHLDLPPTATVDIDDARSSVLAAEEAIGPRRFSDSLEAARHALDLLAGDFLPGFDGDWVRHRREELGGLARRAEHATALGHLGLEQPAAAVEIAVGSVNRDPFDETAHRVLMRAHAAAGERAAALAAYERCRRLLDEELGVRPCPETEALFLELLGDAPGPSKGGDLPAVARGTPLPVAPGSPFVGRSAELAALRGAWAAATGGSAAHAVVIEGEAGAGKTRLALEFGEEVATGGGRLLWGRCSPEVGLVYEPIVEALERALAEEPAAVHRLGPHADALAPLFPGLETRAHADAVATADPVSRTRLFRAIAAAAAEVVDRPTLWVIDDLHWALPDTTALLSHVVATLGSAPVLVVVTCREPPGPIAATLAELARRAPCQTRRLGGLQPADLAELVTAAGVPFTGDLDDLARVIRNRTGGNPFFVDQLMRSASAGADPFDPLAVPAGLRTWIDRRVAALPRPAATTLGLASAVGPEIDHDLMRECSSLPDEELVDVCDDLIRERLLQPVDPPGRLAFVHALVRDAVYEAISPTRRAWLHHRIGLALEQRPRGPDEVAALAHHFGRAGQAHADRASAYSLDAGVEALAHAAWTTAADHFGEAAASSGDEIERRARALIGLGRAHRGAGDRSAARQAFLDAVELARAEGLPRIEAEAVLALVGGGGVADDLANEGRIELLRGALLGLGDGDDDLASGVLGELAMALLLTGRVAERAELAQRSLDTARRQGDPAILARALLYARMARAGPEDTEARLADVDELLALPRSARSPEVTLAALRQRHEDLLLSGDRDGAGQALADAEAVHRRYDHPYWRWALGAWRALEAILDGRLDLAEERALAAFEHQPDRPEAAACYGVNLVNIRLYQGRAGEVLALLSDAADANPHIPCYRAVLALCAKEAGETATAEAAYRAFSASGFSTIPDDTNRLLTLAVLADVAAALGDRDGGRELRRLLEPHAGRYVVHNCFGGGGATWGPVAHQLALLAGLDGDHETARRWSAHAADATARMGAPLALRRVEGGRVQRSAL